MIIGREHDIHPFAHSSTAANHHRPPQDNDSKNLLLPFFLSCPWFFFVYIALHLSSLSVTSYAQFPVFDSSSNSSPFSTGESVKSGFIAYTSILLWTHFFYPSLSVSIYVSLSNILSLLLFLSLLFSFSFSYALHALFKFWLSFFSIIFTLFHLSQPCSFYLLPIFFQVFIRLSVSVPPMMIISLSLFLDLSTTSFLCYPQ